MINAGRLATTLEDYHKSVGQHLEQVHEEFRRLRERWQRLRQHFAGDSADEFEPYWERTVLMFQQYNESAKAIDAILAERIKDMEEINRKTGLLG